MSIPEACIEAAIRWKPDEGGSGTRYQWSDGEVARRVILALRKEMPEEAVTAAYIELLKTTKPRGMSEAVRDAIAAFLTHIAGDTP